MRLPALDALCGITMSHTLKPQDAMSQTTKSTPSHLEVLQRLHACMADLDRLGASVAAAHLSACLDEFGKRFIAEADASKSD